MTIHDARKVIDQLQVRLPLDLCRFLRPARVVDPVMQWSTSNSNRAPRHSGPFPAGPRPSLRSTDRWPRNRGPPNAMGRPAPLGRRCSRVHDGSSLRNFITISAFSPPVSDDRPREPIPGRRTARDRRIRPAIRRKRRLNPHRTERQRGRRRRGQNSLTANVILSVAKDLLSARPRPRRILPARIADGRFARQQMRCFPKHRCGGEEKRHFHLKNQKQQCHNVKSKIELHRCRSHGRLAALVGLHLFLRWARRRAILSPTREMPARTGSQPWRTAPNRQQLPWTSSLCHLQAWAAVYRIGRSPSSSPQRSD